MDDIRTIRVRFLVGHAARRGFRPTITYALQLGTQGVLQRIALYARLLCWHAKNLCYDLVHGTKTYRNTPASALSLEGDALDCAVWYTPAPVKTLRYILKHAGTDLSRYTFVDYGAGRGRAMLTASEFPFRRVVGIEFDRKLFEQGERNLEVVRGLGRQRPDWVVLHQDARDYLPGSGDYWFFMYAPFFNQVLDTVLENIYQTGRLHSGASFLCFLDDRDGLVSYVTRRLEHWDGWEQCELPPLPADSGALHPMELVLFRRIRRLGGDLRPNHPYTPPVLNVLGSVTDGSLR